MGEGQCFFQCIVCGRGVPFQLPAGLLGQMIPYRAVALLFGAMAIGSMLFLIVIPAKEGCPVFEARREA